MPLSNKSKKRSFLVIFIYFCHCSVLLGCDRTLRVNHIMGTYASSHDSVNTTLRKLWITHHPSRAVGIQVKNACLGVWITEIIC